MTNDETKQIAIALLHANTESDVIAILKEHKLWDDPALWRLYGDRDGNYATIGNQQSRPEAALVEKIVNCVDTRLLNECLTRGIDPESSAAPATVREAVGIFFEGRKPKGESGGRLAEWNRKQIQDQEQFITLAVTGSKPPEAPCITLVDQGEGQTPERMPDTFLSIDRSNKLRVLFVQGKFNMGGTGALKFCGSQSLQLIITRRNPVVLKQWGKHPKWGSTDTRASEWGMTVVRRERPTGSAGEVRNSVYKYLAPVDAHKNPGRGEVLSFQSNQLKAMPDQNRPYDREIGHGSVIKLYEYDVKGFGSHALQPDGLLSRTELLLPQIALPVRMHECRAYRGDPARSFANPLVGVIARLQENPNLEKGYPSSIPITVRNEKMSAQIYAFEGDKADSYRKSEGVIFTINGQTHATIPKTFFDRARVKMGRLAKSLLVMVDCSALSVTAREDLFMNSRDRLSNGELRKAVEGELEDAIGRHPGLRELRERRRNQEIEDRLQDSKPLEDVLESILKSSPTLSKLFLLGQRLSRPHRADPSNAKGGGQGGDTGKGEFKGRPHPTYFRFYGEKDTANLLRAAEVGRRCRIRFETDAENGYFERSNNPGHYHVSVLEGPLEGIELDHNLILFDGVANWSINLPSDRVVVGDELTLECTVSDDTLADPFVNVAHIRIVDKQDKSSALGTRKKRNGAGDSINGGTGQEGTGGKGLQPGIGGQGGLILPPIIEVKEGDEHWKNHGFDESTACKVVDDSEENKPRFVFYINVDNLFLRTDMKGGAADVALAKKKFIWSNVLIGLALIHDQRIRRKGRSASTTATSDDEPPVTQQIDRITKALAPFMVPMIDYLGALTDEETFGLAQKGDDE
jgi:hypothetical protein